MADPAPTTTIVVTPNPIGVGQSVVSGSGINSNLNKPAFDIASISPNGPNPAQALDGPNPASATTILRYPSDTPPYYMSLMVNDYSRASWIAVGKLNETGRIILPLPQQMIDNHNVRYDISDIGIAGAAGFDFITGNRSQAAAELTAAAAGAALQGAAGALGNAGRAGKTIFNGALAGAGIAVNDFMTVMIKGPDYKKREFLWRFSPKTSQETSDLRRIIQLINNSMAPSLTGIGSAFFAWPKIWQPEFVYNGRPDLLALNTFRMKASVLTDASFNYTPNGNFSPFATSKAPTSVEMRLAFLELEFWLAGNFNDDPNSVSAAAAPQGAASSNTLNNIINLNAPNGFNFNGVGTGAVNP